MERASSQVAVVIGNRKMALKGFLNRRSQVQILPGVPDNFETPSGLSLLKSPLGVGLPYMPEAVYGCVSFCLLPPKGDNNHRTETGQGPDKGRTNIEQNPNRRVPEGGR